MPTPLLEEIVEDPGWAAPPRHADGVLGAIRSHGVSAGAELRPWSADSPSRALQDVTEFFSSRVTPWSCYAGVANGSLGSAIVFRMRPARSLLVAGCTPMAAELRKLLAEGAAPGWDLHAVPGGRTPLHALAAPLLHLSGSNRFYNMLERAGFGYVEEIAATPDGGLLELRNSGQRLVEAVRAVIAGLAQQPADPENITEPGAPYQSGWLPRLSHDMLKALQVVSAWAAAERGARTIADLADTHMREDDLPADVAEAWRRIGQLDLRFLAGPLAEETHVQTLAAELLAEVEPHRRLILTQRTFAVRRQTYDALAAELGVTRERVRQLESDALSKVGRAATSDRYAPLRWRAAAMTGSGIPDDASESSPTTDLLLTWLADQPEL